MGRCPDNDGSAPFDDSVDNCFENGKSWIDNKGNAVISIGANPNSKIITYTGAQYKTTPHQDWSGVVFERHLGLTYC